MIAELLATHPHTTPATLTHLATTPGHNAPTRHALLTHPNLPDDTDLTHIAPNWATDLRAALSHPGLTPHRRAAILTDAHTPYAHSPLWLHIATEGDLTPTEIRAAVNAHPTTRTTCAAALAAHPNTPPDLTHPAITHLATHPDRGTALGDHMALIAAAERHSYNLHHLHHLTTTHPTSNPTSDSELTNHLTTYLTEHDSHGTTYAQHLIATLPQHPAHWADAILATRNPHLAAAALQILASPHLTELHPHATLALLAPTARHALNDGARLIGGTDPDTTHAALHLAYTHTADPDNPLRTASTGRLHYLHRRAATNPTTRTDTLTHIAEHLPHFPTNDAIIAAHPNTAPALRARALKAATDAYAGAVHTALVAIATNLTTGDPRPARTIPTQALNDHTHPATPLIHHYAPATAHTHPHWPTTHTGARALLALAPTFAGTLDELLTTAHTIAT